MYKSRYGEKVENNSFWSIAQLTKEILMFIWQSIKMKVAISKAVWSSLNINYSFNKWSINAVIYNLSATEEKIRWTDGQNAALEAVRML